MQTLARHTVRVHAERNVLCVEQPDPTMMPRLLDATAELGGQPSLLFQPGVSRVGQALYTVKPPFDQELQQPLTVITIARVQVCAFRHAQ